MKRIVSYEQATRAQRTEAALQDCKNYLGESFPEVVKNIRKFWDDNPECSTGQRYKVMRNSLSLFVGIEGKYPVRAMFKAAMQYTPEARHPHLTLILTGSMRTVDMDRPDGPEDTLH